MQINNYMKDFENNVRYDKQYQLVKFYMFISFTASLSKTMPLPHPFPNIMLSLLYILKKGPTKKFLRYPIFFAKVTIKHACAHCKTNKTMYTKNISGMLLCWNANQA